MDYYREDGPTKPCMLPCGAIGVPDGTGYRCQNCFCIYGSVATPQRCKDLEPRSPHTMTTPPLQPIDDSEGQTRMHLAADVEQRLVVLVFERATSWISFSPDQCVDVAVAMIEKAKEIGVTRKVTVTRD